LFDNGSGIIQRYYYIIAEFWYCVFWEEMVRIARRVVVFVLCALFSISLFAGDVAQFVNMGFSPDGLYYMFGQYGTEDSSSRSYAEIYTIDVQKNVYVTEGIFITPPTAATAGKSGKAVFEELVQKAHPIIQKYAVSTINNGDALYIMSEDSGRQQIQFREFASEKGPDHIWWEVRVNTLLNKEDNTSSFYLIAEKNEDGAVGRRYLVGSPGIQRKDVFQYNIRSIIPDSTGAFLVFIMEKEMNALRGTSVRFMAETLVLSDPAKLTRNAAAN
jgi:predicted secreted protein